MYCSATNPADFYVPSVRSLWRSFTYALCYDCTILSWLKGSSTLNPDTIRFRTIRIQFRLNPLPIASTLAQYVARYVAQITSDAHYLE